MTTFNWIFAATLAGAALSIISAFGFTFRSSAARLPMLVSYAVGALLGAVFLYILPQALAHPASIGQRTATILIGILAFFTLERLVLWRHSHMQPWRAHAHNDNSQRDGKAGYEILVGDIFHNLVDGILIAAAFITDIKLGIVTAVAIIAHEVPQAAGDYLTLRHSGFPKSKAIAFNLFSSLSTLVGGVIGYFVLQALETWVSPVLALTAASMIYLAIADLIPDLHKRPELPATIEQVLLIALGIATIAGVGWIAGLLDG